MRLPGTTPSRPDDDGAADAGLAAALASGSRPAVAQALLSARVLVPVVAVPGPGEAEMAVPALVAADGRRALPVFSSYDTLRAWQGDARPVPMSGARVLAGAGAEGYDGVVLDVAGPLTVELADEELTTLVAAAQALAANPGATIHLAPHTDPDG